MAPRSKKVDLNDLLLHLIAFALLSFQFVSSKQSPFFNRIEVDLHKRKRDPI